MMMSDHRTMNKVEKEEYGNIHPHLNPPPSRGRKEKGPLNPLSSSEGKEKGNLSSSDFREGKKGFPSPQCGGRSGWGEHPQSERVKKTLNGCRKEIVEPYTSSPDHRTQISQATAHWKIHCRFCVF